MVRGEWEEGQSLRTVQVRQLPIRHVLPVLAQIEPHSCAPFLRSLLCSPSRTTTYRRGISY